MQDKIHCVSLLWKKMSEGSSLTPVAEDVADPSYLVSIHEFQTLQA